MNKFFNQACLQCLGILALAISAASAQHLQVAADPGDIISVSAQGRTISTPPQYQKLAYHSDGALEFEVRVIRSGLLGDVAQRPMRSLTGQPSYQLDIHAGGDIEPKYRVVPPNAKMLEEMMGVTPGLMIMGNGNILDANSTYRNFEVGMVINGAKFWHEAIEFCGSVCVIIDPAIPLLNDYADVIERQERLAEQLVPNTKKRSTAKTAVCELVGFAPGDNDSDRKTTSYVDDAKTIYHPRYIQQILYPWRAKATINLGATEATFRCDSSCNMLMSGNAAPASASAYNGMKVSCDAIARAGGYYDSGNSVRAYVKSQCVYYTKGSFKLDLTFSGAYDTFSGETNFNADLDLGTKGQYANGRNFYNSCGYFVR